MRQPRDKPLKLLLEEWKKAFKFNDRIVEISLVEVWERIVGIQIANQTHTLKFNKGILTVKVKSAPLKNDLFYMRTSLMQKINAEVGQELVKNVIII